MFEQRLKLGWDFIFVNFQVVALSSLGDLDPENKAIAPWTLTFDPGGKLEETSLEELVLEGGLLFRREGGNLDRPSDDSPGETALALEFDPHISALPGSLAEALR